MTVSDSRELSREQLNIDQDEQAILDRSVARSLLRVWHRGEIPRDTHRSYRAVQAVSQPVFPASFIL